jgi:hypothetical protein
MKRHKRRYALAALLAMIVATAGFAFAAANSVEASKAGDGSGAITGYAVTGVSWDLNDTNPQYIDDVTFDLGAAATEVKARVRKSDSSYYAWVPCSVTSGTTYNCAFAASTVLTVEATELEVASAT